MDSKQKFNPLKILYRGNVSAENNKPHGFGVLFQFGDVYVGGFHNGYKHGWGILKCRQGYKELKKPQQFRFFRHGIYIGYFRYNKFITGKRIEYKKEIGALTVEYFQNEISLSKYFSGSSRVSIYIEKNLHSELFSVDILGDRYINCFQQKDVSATNVDYGVNLDQIGQVLEFDPKNKSYIIKYQKDKLITGKCIYVRYDENWKRKYKIICSFENDFLKSIDYVGNRNNFVFSPTTLIDIENVPRDYLCPIDYEIMTQPCLTEYNQYYQYKNIITWLAVGTRFSDPLTNQLFRTSIFPIDENFQFEIFDFIYDFFFSSDIVGTLC